MDHKRVETSITRQDDRYCFHMGKHGDSIRYVGVRWIPRKDGYYQNKHRGLLHKNHTKSDNRLENLVLLRAGEHWAEHEHERGGSDWHSKGGHGSWRTAEYRDYTCQACGGPFQSRTRALVPKWCSERCRGAATRARTQEERVCCVCSTRFTCVKYNPTRTCSRRCTSLYAYTRRSEGV